MPDDKGNYIYMTPHREAGYLNRTPSKERFTTLPLSHRGFVSFEFSYHYGVIKTRHSYANEIATEINSQASSIILGTLVGHDTVLVIPREGVSKKEISDFLAKIIPGFKKEMEEIETSE